jgi:hypothetical protein
MIAAKVRLATIACVAVCGCWVAVLAAPQGAPDVNALMMRIAGRVADYYCRAQHVICLESSTVQPIQRNWSPDGFARTVESELRVEPAGAEGTLLEPRLIRNIRQVNGRPPRERDDKERAGCTDPDATSPEPLTFLLPVHRDEYRFTAVRDAKEDGRAALVIDFMSANRTSGPELVEDPRGHPDCFDWSGPIATRGRVWVDASTFDVLRIERHIAGPVDVRVPLRLQRRYQLPAWLVIDRDDFALRYKPVAFSDPDEVILLPESLEALTVVRSALQSTRRTEKYSHYRRFLTTGRVVKVPGRADRRDPHE